MVTGLVDKLLAVGDEAAADVRHDLHFDVHSEVQFLKNLLLPPHRGCILLVVKFVLLCPGLVWKVLTRLVWDHYDFGIAQTCYYFLL